MDFSDRVLFVVRNFMEYGNYGRDMKKAVKVIHHHHPDISLAACQESFHAYLHAYSDAVAFVNANKDYYRSIKNNPSDSQWPTTEQESDFIQNHPGVPADSIYSMIWFIFDWHHVR